MADEKKISFSAVDNGIKTFMSRLQQDTKAMYSEFAAEAKKQSVSQKEQLKYIQDQIKGLERINDLERQQTKIILDRQLQNKVIFQREYDEKFAKMNREFSANKLQTGMLHDMRETQQSGAPSEEKKEKKSSIFNDLMKVGLFRDLAALIRSVPNAATGLDLVSPALSITGSGMGALAGTALEAATAGQIEYATIGANIGKEAGGFLGDAITRSFRLRSEFDTSYMGFRGLTGMNPGTPGLSRMGLEDTRVAQMMVQVARAAGTPGNAGMNTTGVFGLERGFGIDNGDVLGAMGMQRSGGGSGLTNIQRGLGVALAEGISRTKLGDVIRNQTALLQQFSLTKTTVSGDSANRALFEMNRMGGQFAIGDPRSIANIQSIDSDLSNPSTPFGQALNYAVLRRLNPKDDIFQLRKKQQQGLQTPGFLKGVIDDVTSMTGNETAQKLMLAGRLPNLNLDAVDTLFNNRDKLGSMSKDDLNKMLGMSQIEGQGNDLTSKLMRNQAEVSNAFREKFSEGITALSIQFKDEMGSAATEIAKILLDQVKSKSNSTKGAKQPYKMGAPALMPSENYIYAIP